MGGLPVGRLVLGNRKPQQSQSTARRHHDNASEPADHRPCGTVRPERRRLGNLIGRERQPGAQLHDRNVALEGRPRFLATPWWDRRAGIPPARMMRAGMNRARMPGAGARGRRRLILDAGAACRRLQSRPSRRIGQWSKCCTKSFLTNQRTHDPLPTHAYQPAQYLTRHARAAAKLAQAA